MSTLPSIGDFPAEQIEWQKLLALACTALEKVSGNSGGGRGRGGGKEKYIHLNQIIVLAFGN